MDQSVFSCSARHVLDHYKTCTSVTINVLHAPTFSVYGETKAEIEMLEGKSVIFRCSVYGNPNPHLYLHDKRDAAALNQTIGTYVICYIFQTSCDTLGTYVCAAKNNLSTETSERRVDVRVKCRPQPCSESYGDREFSVLPETQAEVTLCVFAYPQPNSDISLRPRGATSFGNSKIHKYRCCEV
ncbi:hypothetical protein PoB_003556700 [Plakobranchus ocellatus]|uniref:Ig-like domain-containing protein n=1 Tax=Plakobranchus ocellatus TaxID=259542 RepID=A0AAV4AQ41_9GAST|nr:hypothetical protein PoB_003556700 [Plakobranchus ocellatus]